MKRILIKLSGESLMGEDALIDKEKTKCLLDDIRNIYKQGIFERIDT